jgi:hypothetical protein
MKSGSLKALFLQLEAEQRAMEKESERLYERLLKEVRLKEEAERRAREEASSREEAERKAMAEASSREEAERKAMAEASLREEAALELWLHHNYFFRYTTEQIEQATDRFHPSKLLEIDAWGSIHKGELHRIPVAIRTLVDPPPSLAPQEFRRQV